MGKRKRLSFLLITVLMAMCLLYSLYPTISSSATVTLSAENRNMLPKLDTVISPIMRHPLDNWDIPNKEITIVTAFWNIGDVVSMDGTIRTVDDYKDSMRRFQFILNPVVAYFDDQHIANHFQVIRGDLQTEIKVLKQQSLPASFKAEKWCEMGLIEHKSKLERSYIAITHVKYSVLWQAVLQNQFSTSYFEDLPCSQSTQAFSLVLPPGFMTHRISFNAPGDFKPLPKEEIFRWQLEWVSTGLFIGNLEQLITLCQRYHVELKTFLLRRVLWI